MTTRRLRATARRVARALGLGRQPPPPAAFAVGELAVSEVRPLERAGRLTSKLGHLRYRGMVGDVEVKLQELASAEQARFVARVSRHEALGPSFPRVLGVSGRFVVAEWVAGESFSWQGAEGEALRSVAALHRSLHATPALGEPGFDYADYAIDRLRRFAGPLPIRGLVEGLAASVRETTPAGEPVLCHADLTAANLVVAPDGRLVAIDNELLTSNSYPLFDLFNVHRSFGRRLASALLPAYLEAYVGAGGDLSALAEHRDFFQNLWHVRSLGAMLQAGALDGAMKLAGEIESGIVGAHPLFAAGAGRDV